MIIREITPCEKFVEELLDKKKYFHVSDPKARVLLFFPKNEEPDIRGTFLAAAYKVWISNDNKKVVVSDELKTIYEIDSDTCKNAFLNVSVKLNEIMTKGTLNGIMEKVYSSPENSPFKENPESRVKAIFEENLESVKVNLVDIRKIFGASSQFYYHCLHVPTSRFDEIVQDKKLKQQKAVYELLSNHPYTVSLERNAINRVHGNTISFQLHWINEKDYRKSFMRFVKIDGEVAAFFTSQFSPSWTREVQVDIGIVKLFIEGLYKRRAGALIIMALENIIKDDNKFEDCYNLLNLKDL